MEKMEKTSSEKTSSWLDKIAYSQMWFHLIMRATIHRVENKNDAYIVSVDALIRTLLKKERKTVQNLREELLSNSKYGLDGKLDAYDKLLECIVDTLEDSGFLTKDLLFETYRLDDGEFG